MNEQKPGGWAGAWPWLPLVGPGTHVPLAHDFRVWTQTPEIQRTNYGHAMRKRLWGLHTGDPPPRRLDGDELVQHTTRNPAADPERLEVFDVQRCTEVDSGQIIATGISVELTRVAIRSGGTGVLERIVTIFEEITALDALGVPLVTFANLNGERQCLTELVHPDPLVLIPLTWQFRVTAINVPSWANESLAGAAALGGFNPRSITGDDVLPAWNDARNGFATQWGDRRQIIVQGRALVRYFVTFFGTPNRWRVRVGGRIGGFFSPAGRLGAALDHATRRLS